MITNPPEGHRLFRENKMSRIATRSDDPYIKVTVLPGGKYYTTHTAVCECGLLLLPDTSLEDHERHVFAVIWDEAVEECNRYGGLNGFLDEFHERNPYEGEK